MGGTGCFKRWAGKMVLALARKTKAGQRSSKQSQEWRSRDLELHNHHWAPMTLTKMWPEKRFGTDTTTRTKGIELLIHIFLAIGPVLLQLKALENSLLVILILPPSNEFMDYLHMKGILWLLLC